MVENKVRKDSNSNLKKGKEGFKVLSSSEEDDDDQKSEVKLNRESRRVRNTSKDGNTSYSNKKESNDKSRDKVNVQNSSTSKLLGRQSYRESLAIIHSRSPSPESEDDLNIIDSSSDDEVISIKYCR